MSRNIAWIAVLAGTTLAQQPAQQPGKIDGVVTNSVTGDPVKKATVMLQSGKSNYEAATDAAGHFHFDSVTPGEYNAMAVRDGFIPYQDSRWNKPISVAEAQEVTGVSVKIQPLGTVNGRVLDEDDDPISGASVQALVYVHDQTGGKRLNPAGFGSSNDLGEYQILDLVPGRYYFEVTVPRRNANSNLRLRRGTPDSAYPATYYPNVSEPTQAAPTQVAAGAQLTNIDFHLRKASAFHIRGKAIDGETGEAIHNVTLRVLPVQTGMSRGFNFVQTRQDGTFDMRGVVSGSYMLLGDAPSAGDAYKSAREPVTVGDQDIDGVVLAFRKPLDITGKVMWEGSAAREGWRVQVMLQTEDGTSSGSAVANEQGTFSLQIAPGIYRLEVSRAPDSYVKSIRFGDQDVSSGRIQLTQGTAGALTIVCAADVGELQGTVQTDSGEPTSSFITVVPSEQFRERADLYYQLGADPSGKFDYQDIAPGDYKVFAWESGDAEITRSPEFLKQFETKAASVSIPPGGHVSVQLKLISAADVEAVKNKVP